MLIEVVQWLNLVKLDIVDKWFYSSKIATVSELARSFYSSANGWLNYLGPVVESCLWVKESLCGNGDWVEC